MKVKLKQTVFRLKDDSGDVRDRHEGDEVEVDKEVGRAMVASDQAEEVKPKRGGKAKTGPEETRG